MNRPSIAFIASNALTVRRFAQSVTVSLLLAGCGASSGAPEAGRRGIMEDARRAVAAGAQTLKLVVSDQCARYPVLLNPVEIRAAMHPLRLCDDRELNSMLVKDRASLGSVAIGMPNRGYLLGARRFESGPGWEVIDGERAWGTAETVTYLTRALRRHHQLYPDAPRLYVGDLSRRQGGWLRPHRSHRTGRDVDLGYAYVGEAAWYRKATKETLNIPRTWALLLAILGEGEVQYVFMDGSVQALLREHAEEHGFSSAWLDGLLGGGSSRTTATIRHTRGHQTHMHIRYYAETSEETGRRLAKVMAGRRAWWK